MKEKPQVLLVEGDERLRDAAASMFLDDDVHLEITADGDMALESCDGTNHRPDPIRHPDIGYGAPDILPAPAESAPGDTGPAVVVARWSSLRRELGASGRRTKALEEHVLVEASWSAWSSRRRVYPSGAGLAMPAVARYGSVSA